MNFLMYEIKNVPSGHTFLFKTIKNKNNVELLFRIIDNRFIIEFTLDKNNAFYHYYVAFNDMPSVKQQIDLRLFDSLNNLKLNYNEINEYNEIIKFALKSMFIFLGL